MSNYEWWQTSVIFPLPWIVSSITDHLSFVLKNKNQVCLQFRDTMDDWLTKTLVVMVWGIFNSIWSIKFGNLEAKSPMLSILISVSCSFSLSLSVNQSLALSLSPSHCYDWVVMFLSQQFCSIDVTPTLVVLLYYIMSIFVWMALLLLTTWQSRRRFTASWKHWHFK